MKVLLGQLVPQPRNPAANASAAVAALREHPGGDLAVFPEMFLSGYVLEGLQELARDCADGLERIAAAAKEAATACIVGLPVKTPDGVANSAACIDADGRLAGIYSKTHLFGRETEVFDSGEKLMLAQLAGRVVAPLICFDIEFPEPARAACLAGANLIAVPSANMDPFYRDHELLTQARALENRRPLVYVNQVGTTERIRFVGGSRVVDADGVTVALLPTNEEEVEVVEFDTRVGPHDERCDYLRFARPPLDVVRPGEAFSVGPSP